MFKHIRRKISGIINDLISLKYKYLGCKHGNHVTHVGRLHYSHTSQGGIIHLKTIREPLYECTICHKRVNTGLSEEYFLGDKNA